MKTLYTTYNNFAKRVSLIIAILFTAVGAILAEGISTWELVKDVSNLQVGDQIVITSGSYQNKPLYAMSTTQKTNNRGMTAVSQWFPLTIADDAQIITLEAGTKENTFAFNVGNGYLYAASSSNNYLKTRDDKDDNGSWKIAIDSEGVATIKAQGSYTRNWLRYNSSSSIFSCYSSGQGDVQIYKCVGDEPETYTVTYDANGATSGTAPVDNEQYESGAIVKILGSNGLKRTYYSFAGWNTKDDGEGDNYEEGEDFTITDNTTLYAKWDCATYVNIAKGKPVNGTFNLNVTGTQYTCENGFVVSVTDIVPATGYHFDHITQTDVDAANVTINDNAKTITFTKLTTGTSTINVVFAINSHKVTWKLAGGKIGESTADIVETYNYGATISKPDDPTRDGFNFAGWKEESTNEDVMATMPDNDLVYIAQWTAKPLTNYRTLCTYDIILNKNGGTTDGSALVTASKTALTAINPPVYAGHQIAGYYAEPECNTLVADVAGNLQPNTPYTNADGEWTAGEVTLYPKWEALEYTVTWKVGGEPFATSTVSATQPLALPDPAPTDGVIGCCADAFIGWSTKTNPTKAEVFNDVTNAPTITGDQTFHAVFATAAPGAGTSLVTFSEMGYANAALLNQEIVLGDGEGNGDATVTFAQSVGGTAPAYYNDGAAARAYAGNTIEIVSTSDASTLSHIVFTFANRDGNNEISASVGTYADGTWTGTAESVTFTIGGDKGHRRISTIAVSTAVVGDPYTNYVTKCDALANPTLGEATLIYHNDGSNITVKCGQQSSMNTAAKIILDNASNLTCPVTVTASDGFLVSTSQRNDAGYKTSLTISPYKKGSTNYGKLRTIYVRADATGKTENYSGTITIEKTEGTPETSTIAVNAVVNCQMHKLYITNHLGEKELYGEYYADAIIDNEPDTPEEDDCSTNYTFDGWSTTGVEYGSLVYNKVSFPFVMPAEDVTLYPVYQVNKQSDYHRVTEDLGADNWEGQYMIAFANNIFANGKTGGTDGIGKSGVYVNPQTALSDDKQTITQNYGDEYHVTLEKYNKGYVLKTRDDKYNYYTNHNNDNKISASETKSTAGAYAINVVFESQNDIKLCLSGAAEGSIFGYRNAFRYFIEERGPVYLYKKSPLYTTPLICGTIEAEDAVVTSTAGQTIKVNVPITLTSDLTRPNTIEKAVSDNPNFSVTALENAGQHAIAIGYTPTATTDGTETANITLTASNNATTTFQVTGRHLPENFVIAAKWGDNWYVLPADMNSESITEGLLIEVNDPADPTKAIAAPNTTKYGLKSVYTSNGSQDRYATHGERLVFVENVDETTPVANQTLYNGGGDAQNSTNTNIQVNAQYKTATSGYYETHPNRYEWIPTTTDLKDYTLTSAHAFANENARTVSLDNHGIFGTLLQDKSYNGMVRLLPVDNFYKPIELQVVEWKQESVSVMYTGAGSKATTKVGSNEGSDVQLLSDKNKKIDHAVYSLSTKDLTSATNQPLIITIKDDANVTIGSIKLTIPAIVATDKSSKALGVAEENAKATSIVVLDGATLTAATAKYTYDDITVYPGGKLVIGQNGQLGMYSLTLRAGSSWGATEYEHKYPQFLLKGDYSNTSGQINLDYVTTADYYYPLSVPEEVTIGDIKYPVEIYGSNVEKTNKGSFQLKYYDGAQRVAQGSQYGTGWVVVDESTTTTLAPNQGYAIWGIPKKINGTRQTYGIHRIPIKKAAGDLATNEKTNAVVQITAHGINDANVLPNDKGWNYLGNPYFAQLGGMAGTDDDLQMGMLVQEVVSGQWTGGWVNNGAQVRYVTLTNDCQTFEAKPVAEAQIPAFTTFFIQAAQEDGAIALTAPAKAEPSSIAARQYAAQQEAAKEITTGILLTGNDQTDRTGLLIADNFTEEYEFNADLSKFENSGINLYTIGKTGNLAYMAINQTLAEQPIPVGYTAPAEGLYTIAFDEDRYNATDISALYLIDYDSNEKTNLLHTDYSFVTAAGTNNQRFALQVAFAPENATNIEWVGDATVQVGVEGNTLMLNNLPNDAAVHIFDALGRLMYHAPTVPTEMQLTLPTGYYLVRIADKQHAVVIKTVIP